MNDMRLIFLPKKKQKEALINLCAIARFFHMRSMELFTDNPRDYAALIEAFAELAYLVGGISGMDTVRRLGFEWEDGANNG